MVKEGNWTTEAVAENIGWLRSEVGDLAGRVGLSTAMVADVRLAASEAITNVVTHAYRYRVRPGLVRVHAHGNGSTFWVIVEDDGIGIEPRAESPGAGLGLPMIATLAQRVELERSPSGGTRVTLCFDGPRFERASASAATEN